MEVMSNKKTKKYGIVSIVLGAVAIILCILAFAYGLKDGLNIGFHQNYNELGKYLRIIGGIIGGIGLLATIISFIKKEHGRTYFVGGCLSITAIAWEFVAIAIGVIIIIGFVSAFGS